MALFVCRNVSVPFVVNETNGEIKLLDLVRPDQTAATEENGIPPY